MSELHQAAYEVNGAQTDRATFYQLACDPQRSVVVEACAGAGKTWMLVSRMVRSLLEGTAPQHILAITFTKKAAGEMRERLQQWLEMFALQSDHERTTELINRGLPAQRATELAPKLGQLHGDWVISGRNVEIHTIHGWFSRLIKVAPLDVLTELNLPPELTLIEDQTELWQDLWSRFLRQLESNPQAEAYTRLVQRVGAFNVEAWLQTALSNRLELELTDRAGALDHSIESAAEWSPQWASYAHPDDALASDTLMFRFQALASILGAAKGSIAQEAAAGIIDALSTSDLAARGKKLRAALLTAQGQPKKRMGENADLTWAQDWLVEWLQARNQEEAHRVHIDMAALSRLLFDQYAQLKSERGLADMVDLERAASKLLSDPALAGWIQERLDSQTRQLLMDEFQDTSPLQWQTLRSWLEAYAGAGGGRSGQEPMRVFLVGDPKQSIYRFRRADPRVFEAAKHFIVEGLGGDLLACDHTRRNAPGVIHALNLCMHEAAKQGDFPGYRTHTTESTADSMVACLPTILRASVAKKPHRDAWRDSLTQPRISEDVSLKDLEAQQIASAILHLTREESIAPGEIFVLARKRASLVGVAAALDHLGIANVAPESALLNETPEVLDLLAVVDALVSPHNDLSLARALKSPVFSCTDEQLIEVAHSAQTHGTTWWETVQSLGKQAPWTQIAEALAAWQKACAVLPPHDLLQKIVDDSNLRRSLARQLGAQQSEVSWANVTALLNLSLELDSGRDATPYRWIRRVKRSMAALPPRAQADAVQLLTIHGAKGLEADVIFLMDTDAIPTKADSYSLVVDWPESATHPTRCAFIQSQSAPPPSLQALLDVEACAADREELNALYVAITRAKTRLYISRVEPHYQSSKPSWWSRLLSSGALNGEAPWVWADSTRSQDEWAPQTERIILQELPALP
ncbi:MAG TPA: UvrD-helicase domain-containing protein, partial [Aquabacterium sp.]|nr:UvrD-helicase domain-containing protein [Aquabacterium sp.]